jgi:hypothetical protein
LFSQLLFQGFAAVDAYEKAGYKRERHLHHRYALSDHSGSYFTDTIAQIIDFAPQVITHPVCICLRELRVSGRLDRSLLANCYR